MRKAVLVLLLVMGSLVGYSQTGNYVIVSVAASTSKDVVITTSYENSSESITVTCEKTNPYFWDAPTINKQLAATFNKLNKEGYKLVESNSVFQGEYAVGARVNYVFYKQ